MSYTPEQIERQKQAFLSVVKWCSRHAGARIVFDSDEQCPTADVDKKIIHMPKRIAIKNADSILGTMIHEAMHIKHTPKWLSSLCRDPIDKIIFNGLEDGRIETYACGQLRALQHFLRNIVQEMKSLVKPSKVELGYKVLGNIACRASGMSLFDDAKTLQAEVDNRDLITKLKSIYGRIFTVKMGSSFEQNIGELYQKIDAYRKEFKLPEVDPSQPPPSSGEGEGENEEGKALKDIRANQLNKVFQSSPAGCGHDEDIDLSEISLHTIDVNEQARNRIKESLKKSMSIIIDEGTSLKTDDLTAIFTGDIDDLFTDIKSHKTMKTKLYFLMDVSGSMEHGVYTDDLTAKAEGAKAMSRLSLSASAFQAIEDVLKEVREEWGVDVSHDNFIFADICAKIHKMEDLFNDNRGIVGGGTNITKAFKYVLSVVHKDDPANKRIVVILTDGEVRSETINEIKSMINKEAQDIRIVFVGIGNAVLHDKELFRHNISDTSHAEEKIVNSFEEAL